MSEALEVYQTLVEEVGEPTARKVLTILEGIKPPSLRRIDLILKKQRLVDLFKENPRGSLRWFARRLDLPVMTVRDWLEVLKKSRP